MTTKLKVINPITNENYHAGLMIYFSRFDLYYWGIFKSEEIRLERSGFNNVLSTGFTSREVELMVAKDGNTYSFNYRLTGSASWTAVGCRITPEPPQFVGLIAKTWSPTNLVVDFDYLRVNDLPPGTGNLTCPPEDFGFGSLNVNGVKAEGTRPLLVILVRFNQSKISFDHDRDYYDRLIFGPNWPNLVDYFREISYGRFTWSRATTVGPLAMDDTGDLPRNLARAKELAAGAGFDFSRYDGDRNGRITTDELGMLMIDNNTIDGGATRYTNPDCVRPLGSTVDVCTEGAAVGEAAAFATIAHELTHLLGVGYDVYGDRCYGVRLTIMSCTAFGIPDMRETYHLDPWFKIQLGWVQPLISPIGPSGQCELLSNPTTSDYRPLILYDPRRSTREYFLLENRIPVGYDTDVADWGMAVWYVQTDESRVPLYISGLKGEPGRDRAFFLIGPPSPGAAGVDRLWKESDGETKLIWLDGSDSGIRLRVDSGDGKAFLRVVAIGFGGGSTPGCGVNNQAPVANLGGPYQAQGQFNEKQEFGAVIKLDGSQSFDPDGKIVSYFWEFGDKTFASSTEPVIQHFYAGNPKQSLVEYKACLTVTDDRGATGMDCTGVIILTQ